MTKRYQDEIEEILKKAGDLPSSSEAPGQTNAPNNRGPRLRLRRPPATRNLTYKPLLLTGLALLLINLLWASLPLFLTGAALITAAYILYYRAPRSPRRPNPNHDNPSPQTKTWRGRPIDPDDDDPHFTQDRWGTGRRR